MIRLNDVKVKFKDKVALDLKGTIEIQSGERIGIIGSNGAGKTTLIKSILGMVPYEGTITVDLPLEEIAVHMQENQYVDTVSVKTVMEMILGTDLKKYPGAMELIDFFDFRECLRKRFKKLSGGQKQRMTLILVLCQDSPITMFDEVTSGLDFETRQKLMAKIVEWYRDRETTILITSHYYPELDAVTDKILYLDQGRVLAFDRKESLFQRFCGKAVVLCESTEGTRAMSRSYRTIFAPEGMIAFSCDSPEIEQRICKELSELNLNFRRSNDDIEIMTINAKQAAVETTLNHTDREEVHA